MTTFYQKNWFKLWTGAGYQHYKKEGFEHLDNYLKEPPLRILDIGCGMAWESQLFNKKYNTELWLLDGDVKNNDTKDPANANHGKWHQNVEDLLFYHSLEYLDEQLKERKITNYHLVDANNINIPDDIKFDVITSWLSCGFHYPASTYRDLILKHSHANTVVSMDLKIPKGADVNALNPGPGVEIVNLIYQGRKHVHAHIKFI